jgi:Xaa-Pro dipeptidase
MKHYGEDASVQGRKAEIEGKVADLRDFMKKNNLDGLYISKQEHFAWITAGGDNIVTRFVEGGICAILITMTGRYFICNNIETQRMKEEELLDQLGFEERGMWWFENRTMEFVREIIGAEGKFAADIPMENASDANPILLSLEKTLCENEIGRYVHLGKVFSNVIGRKNVGKRPGASAPSNCCGRPNL